MSFSVSQPSFAKNFTQCDVIFAEEETKPSDDEEPDRIINGRRYVKNQT